MRHPRIVSDPETMGGKACISGTRLPVHIILGHLGSGASVQELLQSYPFLVAADIQAALAYAAELVEQEGIVAA